MSNREKLLTVAKNEVDMRQQDVDLAQAHYDKEVGKVVTTLCECKRKLDEAKSFQAFVERLLN